MSTTGGLPPSIKEVLSEEHGYVLVVRGLPGTGKSLFAHELIRNYPDSQIIITSAENISAVDFCLSKDVPNWSERRFRMHYGQRMEQIPTDIDSLHEALSVLVNSSQDIPQSEIVIIDSWSDFMHMLEPSKMYSIQQALIHAARREMKKLILIVEKGMKGEHELSLLHSADGIIQLEKIRDGQRMYRQAIIDKMRAHPVNQDSYLFTLHEGRFTYLPWYQHEYPAITVEREPIPDPSSAYISTGNESLDKLLSGGFPKGKVTLIEVDDLSVPYLETIYIPFLSNHLQQGRSAVILLPEGWSPETFSKSLTQFIDRSHVDERVVFFGRQSIGTYPNSRNLDLDPLKTLQEIRYEVDVLERKFNQEVTELFALDTLENMYGANVVRGLLAEMSTALSSTNRTTIAILSREQGIRSESISHNIHLRVQEICGVLSICGVSPRTNYLAIRQLLSGGFLDYELMPIV